MANIEISDELYEKLKESVARGTKLRAEMGLKGDIVMSAYAEGLLRLGLLCILLNAQDAAQVDSTVVTILRMQQAAYGRPVHEMSKANAPDSSPKIEPSNN